MGDHSFARIVLVDIFWATIVYGRRAPYVVRMGINEYETMLEMKERKQMRDRLHALRRQKLLVIKKQDQQCILLLTTKGAIAVVREQIISKRDRLPSGRWCMVSFDFPITARASRNVFRSLLKASCFAMQHQSLWVSRRNVGDELCILVKMLGITRWVHLYVGEVVS